jgi:hypothetical protein
MLRLSVLDLAPITQGSDAATALKHALDLARNAERLGFHRYWLAEHHNMPGIAAWLARHKGPVILVNQATPRIQQLYGQLGYDLRFLDAPRRISCDGDRTPAQEILATRNL